MKELHSASILLRVSCSMSTCKIKLYFHRTVWKSFIYIHTYTYIYIYIYIYISRISDMPRAGFEPAQNLSSGLVEWSCAVVITATPRRHNATIYDSKKFLTRASSIEDLLSFLDNLKLIKINDILRVLLWNYCCTASQIGYLLLFASLIQLPKMCCHLYNLKNLIYLL